MFLESARYWMVYSIESLYIYYGEQKIRKQLHTSFTQRDMCPTCDYHICGNAHMDKIPTPIIVLSAKAGNAAGAASVDRILRLNSKEACWDTKELLPLENSTIFQTLTDGIKRLKEKQKTANIRDQQLLKIERWRLPDLYID